MTEVMDAIRVELAHVLQTRVEERVNILRQNLRNLTRLTGGSNHILYMDVMPYIDRIVDTLTPGIREAVVHEMAAALTRTLQLKE